MFNFVTPPSAIDTWAVPSGWIAVAMLRGGSGEMHTSARALRTSPCEGHRKGDGTHSHTHKTRHNTHPHCTCTCMRADILYALHIVATRAGEARSCRGAHARGPCVSPTGANRSYVPPAGPAAPHVPPSGAQRTCPPRAHVATCSAHGHGGLTQTPVQQYFAASLPLGASKSRPARMRTRPWPNPIRVTGDVEADGRQLGRLGVAHAPHPVVLVADDELLGLAVDQRVVEEHRHPVAHVRAEHLARVRHVDHLSVALLLVPNRQPLPLGLRLAQPAQVERIDRLVLADTAPPPTGFVRCEGEELATHARAQDVE
eukprot:3772811-Prymnesium_polylepis.3